MTPEVGQWYVCATDGAGGFTGKLEIVAVDEQYVYYHHHVNWPEKSTRSPIPLALEYYHTNADSGSWWVSWPGPDYEVSEGL